jgi:hypothetical protein
VKCKDGGTCVDGKCIVDPCRKIVCPEGNTCKYGQCYGGSTPPPKTPPGGDVEPGPDGSTDPDGNTNPDGGTNPDNGNDPDKGGQTDNGTPKPDEDNNSKIEDKNIGNDGTNSDGGGRRPQDPGCLCSQRGDLPTDFTFFGLVFLGLFVYSRRHFKTRKNSKR